VSLRIAGCCFYTALGFRVLEEMPSLWDADNPAADRHQSTASTAGL
jgi:hypothetical protein